MWEPDDPDIVSSSPKRHQNSGAGAFMTGARFCRLDKGTDIIVFPAQSGSKAW
jgi:hypothetical protein